MAIRFLDEIPGDQEPKKSSFRFIDEPTPEAIGPAAPTASERRTERARGLLGAFGRIEETELDKVIRGSIAASPKLPELTVPTSAKEFAVSETLPILGGLVGGFAGSPGGPVGVFAGAATGAALGRVGTEALLNIPRPEFEEKTGREIAAEAALEPVYELFGLGTAKAVKLAGKTPVGKKIAKKGSELLDETARGLNRVFKNVDDPLPKDVFDKSVREFSSKIGIPETMAARILKDPRRVLKKGSVKSPGLSEDMAAKVVSIFNDGQKDLNKKFTKEVLPRLKSKEPLHSVNKRVIEFQSAIEEADLVKLIETKKGKFIYRPVSGRVSDAETISLDRLVQDIGEFQKSPTPLAAHNLKQRVGSLLNTNAFIKPDGKFTPLGAHLVQLKTAISTSLDNRVPGYQEINKKFSFLRQIEEQLGNKLKPENAHRLLSTYLSDENRVLRENMDKFLEELPSSERAKRLFSQGLDEAVRVTLRQGKIQRYNTGIGLRIPGLPIGERLLGTLDPVKEARKFGGRALKGLPTKKELLAEGLVREAARGTAARALQPERKKGEILP